MLSLPGHALATPWQALRRSLRPDLGHSLRYLRILGPGLVAANAGNDAEGIATYAALGASFGYEMLWMLVLITISLIVVQEMCARMGAVTGKGLSELIRETFGPRWTVFAMLTLLVANGVTTVAEFAGVAAAMELFGVSRYVSVPLAALIVWSLVVKGSYARVERVFLLMCLAFLAYPLSAVITHPTWSTVVQNVTTPSFRFEGGFIYMFVAVVGTTISPYMQVFIQSAVVDKGISARDYRYERAEVVVGSVFAIAIALFIVVSTAGTLFAAGVPVASAADAARALEPLAGHYAFILFGLGLLGASMLAAGVVPVATAFSVTEAFGWERGLSTDPRDAPAFYYLFSALIAFGALVTLIPGLPLIELLVLVSVVNGLLLPILLVLIVRLASDRRIMGAYRNGPVFNVIAWGTTILVGGLALLLLGTTALGGLFA